MTKWIKLVDYHIKASIRTKRHLKSNLQTNLLNHLKIGGRPIFITLVYFIIGTLSSACNQSNMNFTLQQKQTLNGIPSASGIIHWNGELYVIGDNSAWLYQLDTAFEVKQKQILLEGISDSILPKLSKPDFEAMTKCKVEGKTELLIFGSGSKSPNRDILVRVQNKGPFQTKTYDLSNFYENLRTSTKMEGHLLNIEAAATKDDDLFLFNRENNIMWKLSIKGFIAFLEDGKNIPDLTIYQINLPKLNTLQIKISGATEVVGSNLLIFTASVEDTPNPIDDGEVLGSYLGIISLDDVMDGYSPKFLPITNNNQYIPIKVESVEVLQSNGNRQLQLVMVTDSDGGESELLIGELSW